MPGIDVIGDPRGDEIILSRDVLNKLWLALDGPLQTIEVAEKRTRHK